MSHILRTSTEHKTALLADEGNSSHFQDKIQNPHVLKFRFLICEGTSFSRTVRFFFTSIVSLHSEEFLHGYPIYQFITLIAYELFHATGFFILLDYYIFELLSSYYYYWLFGSYFSLALLKFLIYNITLLDSSQSQTTWFS